MADGSAAAPFAAALSDLVQAQTDAGGGYVALDVWAGILDRHFPPPGESPQN